MENRLALVIVVDGLRAASLGTYGNTSFPTPQLDELARQSLVVEWLLADSPTLDGFYRSVWNSHSEEGHFLPRILQHHGVRQWLMTDSPAIGEHFDVSVFDEVVSVDQGQDRSAEEVEETHAARFFAQAIEQLALWQKEAAEQQRSGLLWIHFSGLCGPWDAPLELRSDLLDDEDPLPPEFVRPPVSLGTDDPDELLGCRVAYAAQVAVLDACLAGFVESFRAVPTNAQNLTVLTSSRGYSLGEHGCVGPNCAGLYSEQMHLPMLLMRKETHVPLPRVTGFALPTDLGATLREWFAANESGDKSQGISLVPFLSGDPGQLRGVAIATSLNGEQTIRTPAWQLHQCDAIELYAKPDDQWEANDVASRCPDVVQALGELLTQCLQANKEGAVLPKISLSEELHSIWR
jgi:hypothetical protein